MAAELEVDHASLARQAEGLGEAHGRSQETVRAYLEEMASYGRPWGLNNEVGQAIDMCFSAVHEAFVACQRDNLDDYAAYPGAVREMAAVHRSSEDAATAQIRVSSEGDHEPTAS
ncbi:hypothetical protein GCM10022224_010120 [Nonomuraea antimicrobica]|uniref:Uncharacterized protein n=1 Tax=Nonomuraea antimicrobica TaxID=561173 RepID=A0ABP7B4T4_9ACTN